VREGRTTRTEAIVLRSFRYGEADRVLHLLSPHLGRVSAISKGARRTHSRLGGRLEPLSHVQVMLRRGSGEMATVTGADLIAANDAVRTDPARLAVALVGVEAVVRLFPEAAANGRLFSGLARFLEVVSTTDPEALARDAGRDPLALGFCLKLIALAGWAPHLDACAACGRGEVLTGYSVSAGGATCATCREGFALVDGTLAALRGLLEAPLGGRGPMPPAVASQVRRIVDETMAEHTGAALRTLRG
jgi:DNA repair protein RecO (recombination protein O)